jgi:type I restriction enzyme S subunit
MDGFTEATEFHGYQLIRPGQLAVHRMDAFAGAIGVSDSDGMCSPVLTVLDCASKIDAHYLALFLREAAKSGWIEALAKSIRERTSEFGWSDLSSQSSLVPPLDEQKAIVSYLDLETSKIDLLISKKDLLVAKLLERRQSLITHVVTQGLDPHVPMRDSGVQWLGPVPRSWTLIRLDTLFKNMKKKNDSGLGLESYLSLMANVGIIPYAEKGNVGNKAPEEFDKCKTVDKGDFVLNSMNFGIGSFGVSAHHGILSPAYLVLRPTSKNTNYSYFSSLFMTSRFREYAQMLGSGILEHRAAIPWEKLKCVRVPVPSLAEQDAIAKLTEKELGQIDILVAKSRKAIELLKERRQALITQVVTGKIDVRGFADGNP